MIFDVLENAHRYTNLTQGFQKGFEFLLRPDLSELPVGDYEIDGRQVYASIARETGRSKTGALLEAHEQYIDIQLVLAGIDNMGWKTKKLCENPCGEYDKDEDIQFFNDVPELWLPTTNGYFAIFFPDDAHMPLISSGPIHKVVVKIAVNQG
ncbi:YhcH/YjgK/YiaL family protein [Desulfosediminicola flagellatus]|uniref:YhcH/YjgK/YiaL family protein n=1 Tax=Desulfosediminicola flagellatus TaxID=2569541 RepID=UPI0010ABD93B|nr:YhcH/YjgK/YiaL family protein [Desulfosediminicola flagellatus]